MAPLLTQLVLGPVAYEAGGRGGGRPPWFEKNQGKLCFQGERKLLKSPER